MSEILLKASEAQAASDKVKAASAEAAAEYDALKTFLQNLGESFRGQTATAFQERYDEWNANAVSLNEALTGLGEFLGAAANQITDLDTQLANNLRG